MPRRLFILIPLLILTAFSMHRIWYIISEYVDEVFSIANLDVSIDKVLYSSSEDKMVIILKLNNTSSRDIEVIFLRGVIYDNEGKYIWSGVQDRRYNPLTIKHFTITYYEFSITIPSRVRKRIELTEGLIIRVSLSVKARYITNVIKQAYIALK